MPAGSGLLSTTTYEADLTPSFANTHTGKGRAARSGLFFFVDLDTDIARHLADVRQRIEKAAIDAGRAPSEVTLLAVSKTFDADYIRAAAAAGPR